MMLKSHDEQVREMFTESKEIRKFIVTEPTKKRTKLRDDQCCSPEVFVRYNTLDYFALGFKSWLFDEVIRSRLSFFS